MQPSDNSRRVYSRAIEMPFFPQLRLIESVVSRYEMVGDGVQVMLVLSLLFGKINHEGRCVCVCVC